MEMFAQIIDMTGMLSIICFVIVLAVFWRKNSKVLRRLHKPFTLWGSIFTLVHTIASLIGIATFDLNVVLVVLSGLLSLAGLVVCMIVLIRKKREKEVMVRLHIIYSFIFAGMTIIHVILAEILL